MKNKESIIEEVYETLKMTPDELARELEVSVQAISQWKKRGVPRSQEKIMELLLKLHEKDTQLASIKNFYKTMEKISKS